MAGQPVDTHFSSSELIELGRAYDGVCAELGINQGDGNSFRRERVAQLIFEFAKSGEIDAVRLKKRAVALLSGLALIGWTDPLCENSALALHKRRRKRSTRGSKVRQ